MKSASFLAAILAAMLASAVPARAQKVDLLLVLAADVSRSINDDEFNLQRKGYAAALVRPAGFGGDYQRYQPINRFDLYGMVGLRRAKGRCRLDDNP
jgi:hypothetical protein